MKLITIFTILFLMLPETYSRTFSEDMSKVRESYEKNYISMNLSYRMYNKESDSKPTEVQTLWLETFGRKLHYKGQGMEVIYSERNMLMVSEEDKEITLDTVMDNFNRPDYQMMPIDTAVSKMKEISYTEAGNNLVRYTLIPKDASETSRIVYLINTSTWLIEKIEIYSGTEMGGGKVEISYTQVVKKSTAPTGSFNMGLFISPKKTGGYSLTEKYRDYKFYHRNDYIKKTTK